MNVMGQVVKKMFECMQDLHTVYWDFKGLVTGGNFYRKL